MVLKTISNVCAPLKDTKQLIIELLIILIDNDEVQLLEDITNKYSQLINLDSKELDMTITSNVEFSSDDETEENIHDLEWMQIYRKEQYDCAIEIIECLRKNMNIIVRAEEKSGKRIICEILKLLDDRDKKDVIHLFITSLNRLDILPQFKEQEKYGIESITINNKSKIMFNNIEK